MYSYDKYIDRQTNDLVAAFKYNDIRDFPKLKQLIGDVRPTISEAQTRIYENKWIVRYDNGEVKIIKCPAGDLCFRKRYEKYK